MNIIESYSGTLFQWSDAAINNNITGPIFSRMGSIINAILAFRPAIVMVAMFGLMIGFFMGLGSKSKDKNKKSLENK